MTKSLEDLLLDWGQIWGQDCGLNEALQENPRASPSTGLGTLLE